MEQVNLGSLPDGTGGDSIRVGFQKCNDNFAEVAEQLKTAGGGASSEELKQIKDAATALTARVAQLEKAGAGGGVPAGELAALKQQLQQLQTKLTAAEQAASGATSKATAAQQTATTAQQTAASAQQTATAAQQAVQAAYGKAVAAESAAASAEGAVNNVSGKLATKLDASVFNEFKSKAATKEELEQMRGMVLSASQIRGKIELLPFPADALPKGWYHANGDQYEDTTPQGKALSALPDALKQAFRIVLTGTKINLPNFYHTDGRGYFLRASKTLGTVQDDAIRNIVGNLYFVVSGAGQQTPTGAFGYQGTNGLSLSGQGFKGGHQSNTYVFNAANVVPTANENRPLNIGLTPAIYLGV